MYKFQLFYSLITPSPTKINMTTSKVVCKCPTEKIAGRSITFSTFVWIPKAYENLWSTVHPRRSNSVLFRGKCDFLILIHFSSQQSQIAEKFGLQGARSDAQKALQACTIRWEGTSHLPKWKYTHLMVFLYHTRLQIYRYRRELQFRLLLWYSSVILSRLIQSDKTFFSNGDCFLNPFSNMTACLS